jgi:DNA repair ATPase RecN
MMRKLLLLFLVLSAGATAKVSAQAEEIEQLLLNVEKLAQLKQILSDLKKGYEIINTGYATIKDISQGNFNLHKAFLDGLMEVSPSIRKYRKVADIINFQIQIVKEYKHAYGRFRQDGNFAPDEIEYLRSVYANLFNQSLKNLDALATVITANKLRMSDDERIKAIDDIFDSMLDKLSFVRHFNNNTIILAIQRARDKNDVATIEKIYGINN